MKIPAKYRWLNELGVLPRMIQAAIPLLGTLEVLGDNDCPAIIGWASQLGLKRVYTADSIPWCGLFIAKVARDAGKTPVKDPLWALNWAKFGTEAGQPMLGDVLTFTRNGGGHVGLYVAEDASHYHVLGGNQGDAVTIARIEKKRLYRARRAPMMKAPVSVQPFVVDPGGTPVTTNEA